MRPAVFNLAIPVFASMLVAGAAQVQPAQAQTYDLVEPGGAVTAQAHVDRGRLIVQDRTGQQIYFNREPRYDSADDQYVGYYNFELNRVLRFPRSGYGVMQTVDLDDPAPRYRTTRRIVRPSGQLAPGQPPPYPLPDPYFGSPAIAPPTYPLWPYPPTPVTPPLPQSVLIDTETIPLPPLPPAQVRLANGGPRDIQVALVDRQQPGKTRTIRIAPGQAADVTLVRDAGVQRIQTYRVISPTGQWETRREERVIPPPPRYEVVVHQWQIQSVAIDRTEGAGADPIEDINFQGRGIGRFLLPPGPELESGVIDVYRAAKAQGNELTVAPILATEDDPDEAISPLERAILDAQRRAAQR